MRARRGDVGSTYTLKLSHQTVVGGGTRLNEYVGGWVWTGMNQQNLLQLPSYHPESDFSCPSDEMRVLFLPESDRSSTISYTDSCWCMLLLISSSQHMWLVPKKSRGRKKTIRPIIACYQTVTASNGRKRMFTGRDHHVDSLSPKVPPPPFPMSVWSTGLLEERHGCCVHYHCGQPWNYRRGAAKRRGMPETRPGLTSKPVIKTLQNADTMEETKMSLQRALFLSWIKSQNPFSKIHLDPTLSSGWRRARWRSRQKSPCCITTWTHTDNKET